MAARYPSAAEELPRCGAKRQSVFLNLRTEFPASSVLARMAGEGGPVILLIRAGARKYCGQGQWERESVSDELRALNCRDAQLVATDDRCAFRVRAGTDDEILEAIAVHLAQRHQVAWTPELAAALRAAIRTVGL